MAGDHIRKYEEIALRTQTRMALDAINRPYPYRPLKVVPHDPARDPRRVTSITGWITTEIFLVTKTPQDMEIMLGFDRRPGHEYLPHGIDVFRLARPIQAGEFELGGAYTYLPGGKPWDGKDLHWPPGTGATQWKLIVKIPCVFLKTVPRGVRYV